MLAACVAEAQTVVNSRPLTYLPSGIDEEPLTPSHLVKGTAVLTLPPVEIGEEEEGSAQARLQHTLLVQALTTFRERWRQEYLTSLLQRHEKRRVRSQAKVQPGTLVLLSYPRSARYSWPLARIVETFSDSEGVVRSVKVLCRGEEYLRPVSQIVPLELDDERDDDVEEDDASTEEMTPQPDVRTTDDDDDSFQQPYSPGAGAPSPREPRLAARPVRRAAVRQRQKMQELVKAGYV